MADEKFNSLPGQQPPALVRAVRVMLRPLVKFLLERGITYPVVAQWLKYLFVEVAEKNFSLPNKAQTDSRINLLTGIHRKDVKRLRGEIISDEATPKNISLGAVLVAKWTGISDYLNSEGRPAPLPRQSTDDDSVSFDQLVVSVNKDIRPRVVIDEWLRLGIISIDQDNLVHLNTEAFVPQQGIDELAFYFGRNLRDHILASTHNLSDPEKRFLERSVYYDKLSPESVLELNAMAEKHGMEALQALNRKALILQDRDNDKDHSKDIQSTVAVDMQDNTPDQRINFGVYFYSATEEKNKNDADG